MESPTAGSMLSEPGTAPIAANVILDLSIHRSAALRLATRIAGNAEDAEDIVQEAFLRLVRFRSTLRAGPEARALLLRCVLLAGRNFYASKRRRQDHEAAHVRNRDPFSKSAITSRAGPGPRWVTTRSGADGISISAPVSFRMARRMSAKVEFGELIVS